MAGSRALHEGDDVLAGSESVAELHHFDGSSTRLDANATAALDRIADPDGRPHLVLRLGPGNSFHRTLASRSRGQYEVRTPSAAALARTATFVAVCHDDGSSAFTALGGTVVVRGTAGGTVVLRHGETVSVASDGTVGDVEPARLDDDEWVAVNAYLDAEEAPEPAPAAPHDPEPEAHPEPAPAPQPEPTAEEDDRSRFVPEPDDHPWKVGVAAAVALGIGIFSIVIGRAGSARPIDTTGDPAIAVPGPPAFSTPAFTAPASADPADTPPRHLDAAPAATQAPPPAPAPTPAPAVAPNAFDVVGRSCSRGGGSVITFTGSLRNRSTQAHTFSVRVRFIGSGNTTVATATTRVAVDADSSKTFRVSTGALRNARAAGSCDADRVEVVA